MSRLGTRHVRQTHLEPGLGGRICVGNPDKLD
jgi:hypothetical protein